ncbi:GAP family protein [Streptomyces sp. NPDC059853]|uniref:GAP family protein n=1 Tax=Streptomyces sp. NPDC059853 TaxID=3346973 RepID=UPI003650470E
MDVPILPLAITMMAGPQIVSAIILVTVPHAVRVSLAFLCGVALAVTGGVLVMLLVAHLVGGGVSLGSQHDLGSVGNIIKYVLVGLLVLAALKNWRGRETSEPPSWLSGLMTAGPSRAFSVGLLIIVLMPSDLIVLLTVGVHLTQGGGSGFAGALPFIVLTVLIAALPLLVRLLFRRRAETAMPAVRDWMNSHSWLINIGVCALFVVLILSGG